MRFYILVYLAYANLSSVSNRETDVFDIRGLWRKNQINSGYQGVGGYPLFRVQCTGHVGRTGVYPHRDSFILRNSLLKRYNVVVPVPTKS